VQAYNARLPTDVFNIIAKPGVRYRDFGKVIEDHAKKNGLSVVRTFCGHGINDLFHTSPNVPHYASKPGQQISRAIV
jgi:methionine aminopeptidase